MTVLPERGGHHGGWRRKNKGSRARVRPELASGGDTARITLSRQALRIKIAGAIRRTRAGFRRRAAAYHRLPPQARGRRLFEWLALPRGLRDEQSWYGPRPGSGSRTRAATGAQGRATPRWSHPRGGLRHSRSGPGLPRGVASVRVSNPRPGRRSCCCHSSPSA